MNCNILNFFKESVVDVFSTYPQPISVKTIKHFFQLLLAGK